MLKKWLSLSFGGPTVLVSLLLLALCVVAGVLLQSEQAISTGLGNDLRSATAAHDLHKTLKRLAAKLRGEPLETNPDLSDPAVKDAKAGSRSAPYVEAIEVLNQRMRDELSRAWNLADKDKERDLVQMLEVLLNRYLALWAKRSITPPDKWPEVVAECVHILDLEAAPLCHELEAFNANEGVTSEEAYRSTVGLVVKVLLGIGIVGALAGLLVGYTVARRLRHDIYHLRVRVQDAASKLGQDLPAVALQEDADLAQIQLQMQMIAHEIEQVVQKLQQREREVLRAEQLAALGQLAAGVAHEIRNPLTSIKMLVQTLREDLGSRSAADEDLEVIEVEIRRMERCLQSFLDYARPPKPERRPLDLAQPIERTLALVGGRARQQNVAIEFVPPSRPIMVVADSEQLRQLLLNLMLNALDVMPLGGTLKVEARETAGGEVELTVADTGPGIADKLLPALFQPFVSTKETGLGLGLVTSRRIAENHGGVLLAANRPEGGACFTLRLPPQPALGAAAPERQSA
jgi:signal transduction histidine kinase